MKQKTIPFLLVLLPLIFLSRPLFSQTTHVWQVEEDSTINAMPNDSISFGGLTNADSMLVDKSDRLIKPGDILGPVKSFYGGKSFHITRTRTPPHFPRLEINIINLQEEGEEEDGEEEEAPKPDLKGTSIIEDAIEIRKNLGSLCSNVFPLLSKKYGVDSEAKFKANTMLSKSIRWENCDAEDTQSKSKLLQGFSAIGGLDVTKYADGLAKFLVGRVKEELTIEFFQDFKDALNSKEYEDFQMLFPTTATTLQTIDDKIYNYRQFITTLQENFLADLVVLPDNFKNVLEQEKYVEFFDKKPVLKTALMAGNDIWIGIRDDVHPGDIINDFRTAPTLGPSLKGSIESIQLISNSLRDSKDTLKYWVHFDTLRKAFRDSVTTSIYLGLLAEVAKEKEISFAGGKTLFDIIMSSGSTWDETNYLFERLANHTATIDRLIAERKKRKDSLTFSEINQYINSFNELLKTSQLLLKKLDKGTVFQPDKEVSNALETITTVVGEFSHLYTNVQEKRYSAAVANVAKLYKSLIIPISADATKAKETLDVILKYGTFAAAMLEAKDSDEVVGLIENYALPAGSARLKRKSSCSISLNAFVGPFGGVEMSSWKDKTIPPVFGLSAPVGVAFNWGKLGKKENKSLSLFFSLIDVGTIAELRFTDEDSELAKVYLREIFSPGAFLSWGLGDTPFSINLGAQQTALLKSVGVAGGTNEVVTERTARISLSFVVDIPLFNLHSKP